MFLPGKSVLVRPMAVECDAAATFASLPSWGGG